MTRILAAICLSAGMVVFGAQNWDHVPISLLFGAPTRIRLVFLLAIGWYVWRLLEEEHVSGADRSPAAR